MDWQIWLILTGALAGCCAGESIRLIQDIVARKEHREGMKMTIKPPPPPRPRRIPKSYVQVGQRVICVDASPNPLASHRKLLVRIYVIRAIDLEPGWKWLWWGLHLKGIKHCYPESSKEWAFHPDRFRPATERRQAAERPTDITIFRELAASVTTNAPLAPRLKSKDTPDGAWVSNDGTVNLQL